VAFVRVASLSELPEGGALGVEAAGVRIAVARVDGEVYAFADNCSHRDFPLSHGEVDARARTITCEWHGAAFCLLTGEPTCPPATRPIAIYRAKVEDGAVCVEIADEEVPAPKVGGLRSLGI
jgi:3-phenylpropionate/trans-cinnamate dioxygenase ferredoxin subunit